jgi:hypothetical protein
MILLGAKQLGGKTLHPNIVNLPLISHISSEQFSVRKRLN